MTGSCTALVLAAGEGRRMGGPKVLLELANVPLVRLHVEQALALGCTRALVIVRPALTQAVEAMFAREPCSDRVQIVAAATSSQASSLATLVRALQGVNGLDPDVTLLITPVDTLPCSSATHRALRAAMNSRTLAATPRYRGRGGHPVLVKSELLAPYLVGQLEGCPPLREVLARAGERRARVDVADAGVISDVDTPADAYLLGLRLAPALETCGRPLTHA